MTTRFMYLAAASALATATVATSASADSFNFALTSAGGDIGSGSFTATGSGNIFTVTGVTGTINGVAIAGLSPYAGADQSLALTGLSHFSFAGISFADTLGKAYNLTNFPGGTDHITNSVYDANGDGVPEPFALTFSLSAVPEAASWAMMIVGFGAVGYAMRRRRSVTTSVSFA